MILISRAVFSLFPQNKKNINSSYLRLWVKTCKPGFSKLYHPEYMLPRICVKCMLSTHYPHGFWLNRLFFFFFFYRLQGYFWANGLCFTKSLSKMSAQDWWAMKKYLDTQNRLNKYLLYELSPALSLETEFFFFCFPYEWIDGLTYSLLF